MAFLAVVQFLQDHHGDENIVFFELKQRGWIMHQDIGIEDIDALAAGH
jgi:hypothetical protein